MMRKSIRERTAEALNVSKEVIMDIPHITLAGDREAYIENYKGIVEYRPDTVSIRTNDGILSFCGAELRIDSIRPADLFVSGRFERIEFKNMRCGRDKRSEKGAER